MTTSQEITEEEYWPERIIAQHTLTYNVGDIKDQMTADNEGKVPTLEEVIDRIYEYIKSDFSCGWGHEAPMKEIIVFDQDGEEY